MKVNYEKAWKELKKTITELNNLCHDMGRCVLAGIKDKMDDLEKKHEESI